MRVARLGPALRDPTVSQNDPQTAENCVEVVNNGGPVPGLGLSRVRVAPSI